MRLSSRAATRIALPTRLAVTVVLAGLAGVGCGNSVPQDDAGTACDGAPGDLNSLECVPESSGGPACMPSYVCRGGTCPAGCVAEPVI